MGGLSKWNRSQYKKMKVVENKLRDEVRNDILMQRMKKKQKDEQRKRNILKGAMVVPIRNMYKLRKLKKHQWQSVMKASVNINHTARNQVKNGKMKMRPNWQ